MTTASRQGAKNGYRYRCRHGRCRARVTLRKLLVEYVREPRCKQCGGSLTLDHFRQHTELKKNICHCDGYWFPHRKGGGVWCTHHPTGPSDEELEDRYGAF